MTGKGRELRLQAEAQFPNSIGMVYSAVTAALGFGFDDDWHKTMWLSPTGENEFREAFNELIDVDANGLPVVNIEYFEISSRGGSLAFGSISSSASGLKPRAKEDAISQKHRNLAASLQARVEDVLCEISIRHREQSGEENLCLAGGVALNSLACSSIERRAGFKHLFVQPAAGNAGCSIGAALYVWHQLLGNSERVYQMEHAFLGPQFNEEEIKSVLDNCKLVV